MATNKFCFPKKLGFIVIMALLSVLAIYLGYGFNFRYQSTSARASVHNPTDIPTNIYPIVGGEIAGEAEFPFFVSLTTSYGRPICGGGLISPEWVITAAHCMDFIFLGDKDLKARAAYTHSGNQYSIKSNLNPLYAITGINHFDKQLKALHYSTIDKIYVHELYIQGIGGQNDIALLHLYKKAEKIPTLSILNETNSVSVMKNFRKFNITGFGATVIEMDDQGKFIYKKPSADLKKIEIGDVKRIIYSDEDYFSISASRSFFQGPSIAYKGDSGGPGTLYTENLVYHWGVLRDISNIYGVFLNKYTFTNKHYYWINKYTGITENKGTYTQDVCTGRKTMDSCNELIYYCSWDLRTGTCNNHPKQSPIDICTSRTNKDDCGSMFFMCSWHLDNANCINDPKLYIF